MKARFSNVTIGFTIAGLVFGLLMVADSLLYGLGSEATKDVMRDYFWVLLVFCPPGLGLMALDSSPWYDYAIGYTIMVAENVLLYWVLGIICNLLWKRINLSDASSKI